jgi:hypothetical protein
MRSLLVLLLVAGVAAADPPSGYKCGPGGRVLQGRGCACPSEKLDARDADNKAICAPRPPPVTTACLADRKGKQAVKIDSKPQGATIYLGSKACGVVGTTPWTGKLVPGPVTILVERTSYEPSSQELVVATKPALQAVSITLARTNVGTVDIRADADANVSGAKVLVDGADKGVAPIVLQLPGGRRTLELVKPGFDTFTQSLEVVDSGTLAVIPVLVRSVVVRRRVIVDADVTGAEVWLAGAQRGLTPMVLELVDGTYELEVRKGAAVWKQSVVVTADLVVRPVLAGAVAKPATTGRLEVTSQIPGEVLIDGVVAGKTPLDQELAAGEYWVVVRAAGYRSFERRVTIVAGATVKVVVPFVRVVDLRVESIPAGSSVFVDGTRAGATPITLQLTLGEHRIFIERPGYQRHEQVVKIVAGAPLQTIIARLQP